MKEFPENQSILKFEENNNNNLKGFENLNENVDIGSNDIKFNSEEYNENSNELLDLTETMQNTENNFNNDSKKILTRNNREYNKLDEERVEYLRDVNEYFWKSLTSTDKNKDKLMVRFKKNGAQIMEYNLNELETITVSPKLGQRSLVIVFDGTGSMFDDLAQMIEAAKLITKEFTESKNNPIFNYIFVPFRDPYIGPKLVTQNVHKFLEEIREVYLFGGGDCPESSIGAINLALESALPKSDIFIFTDATAKDYKLDQYTTELIQKHQATLTFLLTGHCKAKNSEGYRVYEKLAMLSNGEVYNLQKINIREVLLGIRSNLQDNKVPLRYLHSKESGQHKFDVPVDSNLKQFSISVTGQNPTIDILDPKLEKFHNAEEVLNLQELKILNVPNPEPGNWNVKTESNSEHSVKLIGLSDLNFNFEFVTNEHFNSNFSSANINPVLQRNNILKISPSNMKLLHNLTSVELEVIPIENGEIVSSNQNIVLQNIILPLHKLKSDMNNSEFIVFGTNEFKPPDVFKIYVNGFDFNGNPLQHLLSTAMKAIKGDAPRILNFDNFVQSQEGDSTVLECKVLTQNPVEVFWLRKNKQILSKDINLEKFDEFYISSLKINNLTLQDSGSYTCIAENENGYDTKYNQLVVKEKEVPLNVHMIQDHLNGLNEGDVNYQLSCIGTPNQNLNFKWYFNNNPIQHNNLEIDNGNLLFKYIDRNMAGNYTCMASNGKSAVSDSSYIDIKYGPEILRPLEEEIFVNYGENYEFDCESVGNPQPQLLWKNLNNSKVNLESGLIKNFDPNDASTYQCVSFNNIGPPQEKIFKVKGKAAGPPKIQKDFTELQINIFHTLNLSCTCELCDPIIKNIWTMEDFKRNYEPQTLPTVLKQKDQKLFSSDIIVEHITREDEGIYTCRLDNEHGTDTWSVNVIILESSKIIDVTSNSMQIDVGKFKTFESENYEFTCEAEGNPMPEIKWFKYNEFLEKEEIIHETNDFKENNILQISNINSTHIGKYVCLAENSIGFDSKNFSIDVLFSPKLKSTEETVIIIEDGKEVTMQCSVEGNPFPQISWKYNNQSLKPTSSSNNKNNNNNIKDEFLRFIASLQNSGIYECQATNELGFVKKNIILIVFAAPRIQPPIKEIIMTKVGENAYLPCNYTGYPMPDIKWRFNNSPQDSDFIEIKNSKTQRYGKNELFLTNVSRAMEGIYLCEVENEHGIARKSYFLEVNYSPHIKSNFKPIYKLKPNDKLEIICEAEGKPEPKVGWEKSTKKTSNLGAILKLTNTDKSISGVYTCIARSSAGTDVKAVEIIALTKPKFIRRDINNLTPNITAENGQDITLYCPVEYADSFIWYKDNIILNNYENSIGQFLNLKNVSHKESGNYTCSGINEVGSENYTQMLYVNSPPHIHAISSSGERVDEPNFKEIVAQRGDNKILRCLTNGFPLPKVKWFKDKALISNDFELNLINVNVAHSGEYICSAYNQYGSDQIVFNVRVLVPPSSYLPKKNWIEIKEGNDLILECEVYGNPWPKFNWIKDGQQLTDEFQEALIVHYSGLKENGVYKCIAENELGRDEIEFNVNVMAPPIFKIKSNKNELIFNIKNTIELECSVYGNPKPILTWTFNNKILLSTSRISDINLIDETKSKQIDYVLIDQFGNAFTYYDPNEIFGSQLWENQKNGLYGKVIRTGYETNLTLIIDNEKRKKGGIYTCYAINALGTNSLDTKVEIYYKPTLGKNYSTNSESITILKGLPLIFSCSWYGNPRPEIAWIKDNSYISTNYSNQLLFSHDNKTLKILSTNELDSGVWVCTGKNLLGEEQKSFNVEVLSAPELLNDINTETSKLKIIGGSKIVLKCPVIGNPLPEIFWIKENNETSIFGYQSDKYQSLLAENSTELIINNIQESGLYSCFANNSLGSIEKKFTVEILKMPDIILTEPNELNVTEFDPVKIRCQVEGNPKPDIYWYKDNNIINFIKDKTLYLDARNQTLKIVSAQLKHNGKYACVAKNELGDKVKYINLSVKESAIWSPWDSWNPCNVTCGSGVKYRKRRCIKLNGEPAFNFKNCIGNDFESKLCEMPPCPIDGDWSDWSEWEKCSIDCWSGIEKIPIRKRFRFCNNPIPRYGGKICYGEDVQEKECNLELCTVNGGWSAWSLWSNCSVSCGIGVKERFRFCNNPKPLNGGEYCKGLDKSVQSCTLNPCPVDGNWSEWSSWSECSQTCGTGLRKRTRQCNNPKPENGGANCDGSNIEIAKCKKLKCDNSNLFLKSFPITQQKKFTANNIFEMPFITVEYENEESEEENDSNERSESEYAFATGSKQIISEESDYSNTINNSTANSTNVNLENGKFKVVVELKSFKTLDKDLKEMSFFPGKAPFVIQRVNPCAFGKELNTNNECIDIDQCKLKNVCKENEICENLSDSYKCICLKGFNLNKDTGLCEDIDECTLRNTHDCSHNCTNTQGSYICSCPTGFVLKSNNKVCESIFQSVEESGNEFMADHANIMLKDPHIETSSIEIFKRECPNGLEESNGICEDVNECEVFESDCDENYSCLNTFGSYKCIETLCPLEYKKTQIIGQCILMCNESHNCNNNAKIAEIISHTLLSVTQISKKEPFLKIVNYGINRKALPYTTFTIDEIISDGNLFELEAVEIEKGLAYLYAKGNLQHRKLYKIIVEAKSYDEQTSALNYLTKFIIFLYII